MNLKIFSTLDVHQDIPIQYKSETYNVVCHKAKEFSTPLNHYITHNCLKTASSDLIADMGDAYTILWVYKNIDILVSPVVDMIGFEFPSTFTTFKNIEEIQFSTDCVYIPKIQTDRIAMLFNYNMQADTSVYMDVFLNAIRKSGLVNIDTYSDFFTSPIIPGNIFIMSVEAFKKFGSYLTNVLDVYEATCRNYNLPPNGHLEAILTCFISVYVNKYFYQNKIVQIDSSFDSDLPLKSKEGE